MLAGNIALNALENVVCHQKAVGDSNGQISLPPLPPPDVNFNYGAVSLSRGSDSGETVPLVTLDSLNLKTCRVIKIDTEGMEPQVLNGGKALIERCRPLIYVENNEPDASKRLSKVLDAIGYTAWWSIFPYYDSRNFFSNTVDVWQNVVPSSNMLCAPKEANLVLGGLEPFLGEGDDWKACVQRLNSRMQR